MASRASRKADSSRKPPRTSLHDGQAGVDVAFPQPRSWKLENRARLRTPHEVLQRDVDGTGIGHLLLEHRKAAADELLERVADDVGLAALAALAVARRGKERRDRQAADLPAADRLLGSRQPEVGDLTVRKERRHVNQSVALGELSLRGASMQARAAAISPLSNACLRQFRVGLFLANQSKAALRTPDGDVTESIETSVRFTQDFAPTSHRARQKAVEARTRRSPSPRAGRPRP